MTIQFNTDKNLTVHEEFNSKLTALLEKKMNRFSDNITRLEVHLSDDNGGKFGQNDKKCLLEARIEHRSPVAVSAEGSSYETAVEGAVEKMRSALDTIFGRLSDHK